IYYKPNYKIYFVHHTIGLMSIPIAYFFCFNMIKYLLSYLMFELSTPFLNICLTNHRNKIVNRYTKIMDMLFFISYTIVRVIFGSYLLYKTTPLLYSMNPPYNYLIILPVTLQILIFYWYRILVLMLLKKIKQD